MGKIMKKEIPDILLIYLTVLAAFWASAIVTRAADRYVVEPGTAGMTSGIPYNAWTNAATNIQWAVDAAADGETVRVTNGTYWITNQICISNRIILQSMNGYSNTLVAADWPAWTTRCFYVWRTGVVDGFTISNGHWYGSNNTSGGGGAYLSTGTIQNCYFVNNIYSNSGSGGGGGVYVFKNGLLSNCLFVTNMSYKPDGGSASAGTGGGIYLYIGGQVFDCQVISNSAVGGGGIQTSGSGSLEPNVNVISNCLVAWNNSRSPGSGGGIFLSCGYVKNCVISNNSAAVQGGGINTAVDTDIQNSYINNNTAESSGGGIFVAGSFMASNCVIAGNSALNTGGGIRFYTGDYNRYIWNCQINNNRSAGAAGGGGLFVTNAAQVRNCLIYNNTNMSSTGRGGGVHLGNAADNTNRPYGLINCTIVNNYSTNEGGGIAVCGPSNYIVNCVIAGNNSFSGNYPNVYHWDNADANKSNYYYSCAVTTAAYLSESQGNITNDPVFKVPGAGNWRLSANSPCVNRGTNQDWMTNSFDLDRRMRKRYGTVDMGAYETIYEGTIFRF